MSEIGTVQVSKRLMCLMTYVCEWEQQSCFLSSYEFDELF